MNRGQRNKLPPPFAGHFTADLRSDLFWRRGPVPTAPLVALSKMQSQFPSTTSVRPGQRIDAEKRVVGRNVSAFISDDAIGQDICIDLIDVPAFSHNRAATLRLRVVVLSLHG